MSNPRPNILIVMTDQQRADFLRSEGFGAESMPYFESLFAEGVRFRRAYTSMPICTPARISLMTGRFPKAHGVVANWPGAQPRYGRDLVEVLGESGYALGYFGKAHFMRADTFDRWRAYSHTYGPARPGREAEDAAFDEWMTGLYHWVSDGPTPFPVSSQYPVRIVDDALEWLDEWKASAEERPFCAVVSFPEPHSPYQAPEPYYSLFRPESVPPPAVGKEALESKNEQWQSQYESIKHYHPRLDEEMLQYRSLYCAMMRLLDDQMRRLVEALRTGGLLDDTLVLFVADHGEFCGDYGLFRKGLALPEVSVRIPMLWFGGPVRARHTAHPALTSIVDVFPTLCEAVGAPIPPGVQGRSLWPLLTGEVEGCPAEFTSVYVEHGVGGKAAGPRGPEGDPADTIFIDGEARTNFDGTICATSGYRRAVIKGDHKLVFDLDYPVELYHLANDPYELNNLADDPAWSAVRNDLVAELLHWSVRLDDNLDVKRYEPIAGPHNWFRVSDEL